MNADNARSPSSDTADAGTSALPRAVKKVFIVDDHPVVRQGIAAAIEQEPDLAVCGEAAGVADALRAMTACPPDVVVVDLSLKDSSGLDLIKDMQIRLPDVPILVLSMRDEAFYAERVLRAGARGYITKEESRGKFIEGLRRVLEGQIYVSDRIATKVMGKLIGGAAAQGGTSSMDNLTDRELAVLELIGNGQATREIAKRLHISPKTVDSHREHIKEKLQLTSAADLTKYAIQWVQCQKTV